MERDYRITKYNIGDTVLVKSQKELEKGEDYTYWMSNYADQEVTIVEIDNDLRWYKIQPGNDTKGNQWQDNDFVGLVESTREISDDAFMDLFA